MTTQFTEMSNNKTSMITIGSVEDVIDGRVEPQLQNSQFKAKDYLYGFELASPDSIESMGESIITNQMCYSHDTSNQKRGLLYGENFYTSGIFCIAKDAKPNYLLDVIESNDRPLTLDELYNLIYEKVQQPFTFAGLINYKHLHCTAISKAPIFNENIFEHKSKYYSEPEQNHQNVCGFIMGLAADFSSLDDSKFLNQLKKVLYFNPMDNQASQLIMHAHGLLFKQQVEHEHQIKPELVSNVHHVFNDQTHIVSASLKIFSLYL